VTAVLKSKNAAIDQRWSVRAAAIEGLRWTQWLLAL